MNKLIYIFAVSIGVITISVAQTTDRKHEIFFDATSVLGNLLSITSPSDSNPYGFGYRRNNGNKAMRVACNVQTFKDSNFEFVNGDFVNRTINSSSFQGRIGLEKIIPISSKFNFIYGGDLLLGYDYENTSLGNTFNRDQNKVGVGLGPTVRIEFKIHERVYLTTESTLYGRISYDTDTFQGSGVPYSSKSELDYDIKLKLPQVFYISFAF